VRRVLCADLDNEQVGFVIADEAVFRLIPHGVDEVTTLVTHRWAFGEGNISTAIKQLYFNAF
jgi:hypothetical protein